MTRLARTRIGRRVAPMLAPALTPWLVSRLFVAGALLAAWGYGLRSTGDVRPSQGVLVWDGGWYAELARDGYGGQDDAALRFFPLIPLLGRIVGVLFAGNEVAGLLVVANVAALAYLALLGVLAYRETHDPDVPRRVAWFAALAPGAGVLALPYTEPVAGALAVGMFLALRRGNPWVAGMLGLFSGLARPTGVLLMAPALIEMARHRPRLREVPGRAFAVLSPAIGTALYLAWVGLSRGDALLPYTVQTQSRLRGGWLVNPLPRMFTNTEAGLDWRANWVLIIGGVALLVVVARRLPLSYTVWSALMLVASITSIQQHSMPRYLANTFPLLIAAAMVSRSRLVFATSVAVSALGFVYLAARGFTPEYVL